MYPKVRCCSQPAPLCTHKGYSMPIPQDLLNIIVCPACQGELAEHDNHLICTACKLAYPIEDGIPVLLIEEAIDSTSLTPETTAKNKQTEQKA